MEKVGVIVDSTECNFHCFDIGDLVLVIEEDCGATGSRYNCLGRYINADNPITQLVPIDEVEILGDI